MHLCGSHFFFFFFCCWLMLANALLINCFSTLFLQKYHHWICLISFDFYPKCFFFNHLNFYWIKCQGKDRNLCQYQTFSIAIFKFLFMTVFQELFSYLCYSPYFLPPTLKKKKITYLREYF